MKCQHVAAAILVTLGIAYSGASSADDAGAIFIAGVAPSERRTDIPVPNTFEKDRAWFEAALFGISEPYPWSLRFLEDQEAWYTPFSRPGMMGGYDIRNWQHEEVKAPRK